MGNDTKRQHYVPRMILKRHCCVGNPGHVWQFDRLKNEERLVSIRDVCQRKNFYELRSQDCVVLKGTVNLIENMLAKVEKAADDVLNRVCAHEDLTLNDIAILCWLFACQMLRVPVIIEAREAHMRRICAAMSEVDIKNYVRCSSFIFESDDNMPPMLEVTLWYLCMHRLRILVSEAPFILDGEMPIYGLPSLGLRSNVLALPISSHECLLLSNSEPDDIYVACPNRLTDFLNKQVFLREHKSRLIYGSVRSGILQPSFLL